MERKPAFSFMEEALLNKVDVLGNAGTFRFELAHCNFCGDINPDCALYVSSCSHIVCKACAPKYFVPSACAGVKTCVKCKRDVQLVRFSSDMPHRELFGNHTKAIQTVEKKVNDICNYELPPYMSESIMSQASSLTKPGQIDHICDTFVNNLKSLDRGDQKRRAKLEPFKDLLDSTLKQVCPPSKYEFYTKNVSSRRGNSSTASSFRKIKRPSNVASPSQKWGRRRL